MKEKPKRENKKPKQLREAEKAHNAHNAILYKEGFDDGYKMGLEEGKRELLRFISD